jgi:hypothetical protein
VRKTLAVAAFVLTLAPSAWASAPAVTTSQQQQLKSLLGQLGADDLAYVPGHLPANYRLGITSTSSDHVGLSFTNSKYPSDSAKATASALAFAVEPFKGKLAGCAKGADTSLRVRGKTIYWKSSLLTAWQCVRAPSGHIVAVYANAAKLGEAELVHVITSVVRIP